MAEMCKPRGKKKAKEKRHSVRHVNEESIFTDSVNIDMELASTSVIVKELSPPSEQTDSKSHVTLDDISPQEQELTTEVSVELTSEVPVELTSEVPVELTSEVPAELTNEVSVELTSEVPVVSSVTSNLYLDLQTDLHNVELIQESIPEYVASAPVLIETDLMNEIEQGDSVEELGQSASRRETVVHRKISSRIAIAEEDYYIKPLTESQLKTLYYNLELESNEKYIQHFIENYRSHPVHEFYELVAAYRKSRMELLSTINYYEETLQKYNYKAENVWTLSSQTAKAQAKCRDGNVVVGSFEYIKSDFNADIAAEISTMLSTLQTVVSETYALHAYEVELSKLQVENYLFRLVSASSILSGIPKNAPAQVHFPHSRPAELSSHVDNLKRCISILFTFQRQPEKDRQFIDDSRCWLNKLIALLIRVGTFEDHLFILNHVLRCPAGISNWAGAFIQIPIPSVAVGPYPIGGPFLDHVMTVMATLLLPVKAREEFLQNLNVESSVANADHESKWVLVDSEGEEDEDPKNCWLHLRENDLVAVLNQIPVGAVFKHLLGVFTINGKDYYDNRCMTEQEMMKLFSVATQLVRLFRESFKTYNLSRYKQFTKRVSQFIRHLVINVTDHLQAFLNFFGDYPNVRSHLLTEYDHFFLRSTYSIFSSQRKGAWQFMAAMPYTTVSVEMLWKILWLLHNDYKEDLESIEQELSVTGWQKKMSDQHLHLKFEERLSSLPENEAYYLLTAFANMGTSRTAIDRSFIETICGEVFQISFVNETSKEMCFKWGRELLGNLGTKHPFVMSVLIQEVFCNIEKLGKAALYLFQELPVHLWYPLEEDLEILIKWLIECPTSSNENQFSQMVFSQMNLDEKLFLDIRIHRRVAVAIWESYKAHFPTVSLYTESIKQISSIAAALKSGISPDDVFKSWAWKMLRTLKIHINDIPSNIAMTFAGQSQIPDLFSDSRFQGLRYSVRERNLFAIFVAFKLTNVGHGIAEICQNMDYLQYMLEQQCFESVIDLLYLITPMFFNCGHYLWTNKVFISVMQNLLICDLTYLKMAKSMVVTTFPGKCLCLLAHMIEGQFQVKEKMGWTSQIISGFWIETLTTLPNWFKNEAIIYLLDNIFMSTFKENNEIGHTILAKKFQQLIGISDKKNEISHQGASNTLSSFFSWITTGSGIPFTLIQKDAFKRFPWITYAMLEMETQTESEMKLWKFITKEFVTNSMSTPELALKKASGLEDRMTPPVQHLPIYRWALAAVELNDDCLIAPLFWQKFFIYYLQRPSSPRPNGDVSGSVGQRFFSNMNEVFILKKMKQKLKTLINFYVKLKLAASSAPVKDEDYAEDIYLNGESQVLPTNDRLKELFYDNLQRLYNSMSLWLEEPHLHEANLYLPSLLAEYDPRRLSLIIVENSKIPWLEFVHPNELHDRSLNLVKQWNQRFFNKSDWKRVVTNADSLDMCSASGVGALLKRLRSYDEPFPPPLIATFTPVVLDIPQSLFDSGKNVREGLTTYFSVLTEFARTFSIRLANHAALDCFHLELLPQIYENVETEVELAVSCHKGKSSFQLSSDSGCLGPANIRLKFFEMKEVLSAKTRLEQNRSEWIVSINESLLGPPQNLCCSAVYIENAISQLLNLHRDKLSSGGRSNYREAGLSIFYQLCGILDSDSELYPPTRKFLTSCIDILGQEFIKNTGDQSTHIMQMILECPRLVSMLSSHFYPSMSGIETFTRLYQRMITIHKTQSVHLTCVILSKFDLKTWLLINKPKLSERYEIFQLIAATLNDLGADITEEMQMVAELYYQHLTILLRYQFPDMYRDVLQFLFNGFKDEKLSAAVWYHVINSLLFNEDSFVDLTEDTPADQIDRSCTAFAEAQDIFTQNQIKETLEAFGKKIMDCRTSSKEALFQTLFDKRQYIKPVMILLNLMFRCYVGVIKRESVGSLISSSVINAMWVLIEHAFAPWMVPIHEHGEIWYPWKIGHQTVAAEVLTVFVNCVSYAVSNLYASTNILSFVLKFYKTVYSNPNMNEYILNTCHCALSNLPWNMFWPDVFSIDLMIQILNEGVSECIEFLGGIFLRVSWPEVVCHVSQMDKSSQTLPNVIGNLLHLHIRLGLFPTLLQNEDMPRLLGAAATYPWNLLNPEIYSKVIQCFKMSCDPRCVLSEDHQQMELLNLLQMAAEFAPGTQAIYPGVVEKRKAYVCLSVFLLCKCATISKDLSTRMQCFKDVITNLLNHTEAIVATGSSQVNLFEETVVIVTEILNIFNLTSIKRLQEIALKAVQDWAKAHPRSVILRSILFSSSRCIVLPVFMANVSEAVLDSYFSTEDDGKTSLHWAQMESAMKVPTLIQQSLISECLSSGSFLTINVLCGLMLSSASNIEEKCEVLNKIIKWLDGIQLTEDSEFKIILLCWRVLTEVLNSIGAYDSAAISVLLHNFSTSISVLGEDRASQGLLSYIGLGRRSSLSLNMRFFVRALNAFILKQACHFEFRSERQLTAASSGKIGKSNLMKQLDVAEELLRNTFANKQYECFVPIFERTTKYIFDANVQFKDFKDLLALLVAELFPERYCLKFLTLHATF